MPMALKKNNTSVRPKVKQHGQGLAQRLAGKKKFLLSNSENRIWGLQ
jgi:hypothetical protein